MLKEAIGIVASLLIIVSMSFKTSTLQSTIKMRIFNMLGSAVFVVYGLVLPAYSTAFLNAVLIGVNAHHLRVLLRKYR